MGRKILAVAATVLVVAGLVWWGRYVELLPHRTADVSVPATDAPPDEVVRAYLRALDAHDCDTAVGLWVHAARSEAEGWCSDLARVTDIEVDPPYDLDEEADLDVGIGVAFDLRWRPLHGSSATPDGGYAWGYYLQRTSPDAPWRIADEGIG